MAQQKDDNKDLADALAALAAGDHVEPEAGEGHGSEHIEAVTPSVPPPPAPTARPATPPTAPSPSPVARARPQTPQVPIPQGRPASPARPPQPGSPLIPSRSARPVSPSGVAPPLPPAPASAPAGDSEIIDDEVRPEDDAMLAPAPDPSMLAHPLPYRPSPIRRGLSIDAKRTLIPVLLTTGLLLLLFGALRFVMGPDSPYAKMPNWLTALVAVAGLVMLAGAVFTMFLVQHELERSGNHLR
jgi:hypothetical protein